MDDDDESEANSNQKSSRFTRCIKFLNQIAQTVTYSNLLKIFLTFLMALLSLMCFKTDDANFGVNGNQFNSTVPANLSSFSHLDVYIWYAIGVVVSSVIHFYIYNPNMIKLNAILLYIGNGVIRLIFRHFLNKSLVFDYLFRVSQILFITTSLAVRLFDGSISIEILRRAPYLVPPIIIFLSTLQSGFAFNISILFSSQLKSSLWSSVFYIALLIVHCKKILNIDDLIKYYADKLKQIEDEVVDGVVGKLENDNNLEPEENDQTMVWRINKYAENPLMYYWRELVNELILMYIALLEILFGPSDIFKIVFIDQFPPRQCQAIALFVLIYGASIFCGMIIVGIVRIYELVPRLYLTIFAFSGHIITFIVMYYNYDAITLDKLATNNEKLTMSIICTVCIAFCMAIIDHQFSYYNYYFKAVSPALFMTLINIFGKLLPIPMHYLKLNYGKDEHFSSVLVAGSMALAACWYYEKIAQEHIFPDARQGQVRNSGQNVELHVNGERNDGWNRGGNNRAQP